MTYAQTVEDDIIWQKVKGLTGDRTVLDIGAFDGQTYSNSKLLIEKGWDAVLVEPNPFAFCKLLEMYGKHKNVRLINAAVGIEPKLTEFYEGGIYSTSQAEFRERFSKAADWNMYYVPTVTIQQLVSQVKMRADVISIDTEGLSYDILRVLPVDSWAPHIIVVEHDNRVVEICTWARKNCYEACSVTPENVILLRNGVWSPNKEG